MKLRYVLLALIMVATSGRAREMLFDAKQAQRNPEPYAMRWERLERRHYELVADEPGKSYEHELIAKHNTFWFEVASKCWDEAQKSGIAQIEGIAVVEADGKISEFLVMPRRKEAQCFAEGLVGRYYPKPPVAPFYELISITFDDQKSDE